MPWTCTHCESINTDDAVVCVVCDSKNPATIKVIAVAAGSRHNLALTQTGKVIAWGDNSHGQCTVPTHVTDIIAIAGGSQHSLALSKYGVIYAWGSNVDGQCTLPAGLKTATHIYAAGDVSAALCDGTPLLWGRINDGPCDIPALCTDVTTMAVGRVHTLALTKSDKLFAWGRHESTIADVADLYAAPGSIITKRFLEKIQFWKEAPPKKPSTFDVIGIACTDTHSVVLTSDGQITRWNADGLLPKLHHPNLRTITASEAWIAGIMSAGEAFLWVNDTLTTIPFVEPITEIALGETHAIALSRSGNVMLWGSGTHGQTTLPAELESSSEHKPRVNTSFSDSALHPSDAVREDEGKSSPVFERDKPRTSLHHTFRPPATTPPESPATTIELVKPSSRPVSKPTLPSLFLEPIWVCVHCDSNNTHTSTRCDICDRHRYAPSVAKSASDSSTPASVPEAATVKVTATTPPSRPISKPTPPTPVVEPIWVCVHCDSNNSHTSTRCDICDRHRYAPSVAKSASDSSTTGSVPVAATILERSMDSVVRRSPAIVAGDYHVVILLPDGAVVAWGQNTHAQTEVPAPIHDITAIAASADHTVALDRNGVLHGWGSNNHGQLTLPILHRPRRCIATGRLHSITLQEDGILTWGSNSHGQTDVPVHLVDVQSVAAGWHHSLAITSDGKVVAWGDNSHGQSKPPPRVFDVIAVAGGKQHSVALRADGRVVAWGRRTEGQAHAPPPTHTCIAIAAGANHTLALLANGKVHAWGANEEGQCRVPPSLDNVIAIAAGVNYSVALTADGRIHSWGRKDRPQTSKVFLLE
jgi:alpha-tubulin suppressor-like RCC1 family protein